MRKTLDTTLSAEVWENGDHPLSRVESYEEMPLSDKVLMLVSVIVFSELVTGAYSLSYLPMGS